MSWIAKRVAEQRLLWNLRKQEHVVAAHPSDTSFSAVVPHIHQALQRDYERHRNWLIIDTIGLVVSGLLAIVPGPNLLAYYFLWRGGPAGLTEAQVEREIEQFIFDATGQQVDFEVDDAIKKLQRWGTVVPLPDGSFRAIAIEEASGEHSYVAFTREPGGGVTGLRLDDLAHMVKRE